MNVAADEATRQKADARFAPRAVAGENFEKLAAEVSEAPSSANAGLIGPLNLDDLSPDLRKTDRAMKIGDVTQPLRTPRGYQILKLESSTAAETLPFDQAREQIADARPQRQTKPRVREISREAAVAGDHRVEEPRDQEGVRARDIKQQSAAAAPRPRL